MAAGDTGTAAGRLKDLKGFQARKKSTVNHSQSPNATHGNGVAMPTDIGISAGTPTGFPDRNIKEEFDELDKENTVLLLERMTRNYVDDSIQGLSLKIDECKLSNTKWGSAILAVISAFTIVLFIYCLDKYMTATARISEVEKKIDIIDVKISR